MEIPKSFKIGNIKYDVILKESIIDKDEKEEYGDNMFIFGKCNTVDQEILLATKTPSGKDISKDRLINVFYHELAHALVGETAESEMFSDEIFIEALGKNLMTFIKTVQFDNENE